MSAIDTYRHQLLGFIRCPMAHSLYRDGRVLDRLPVYELLEPIDDEPSIYGAPGDVVIGGGSGEASALCFSMPQVFVRYTHSHSQAPGHDRGEQPIQSHWTSFETSIFSHGFARLGWRPERQPLEVWLAQHLMAYLLNNFPERYGHLPGDLPLEADGSIIEPPDDSDA